MAPAPCPADGCCRSNGRRPSSGEPDDTAVSDATNEMTVPVEVNPRSRLPGPHVRPNRPPASGLLDHEEVVPVQVRVRAPDQVSAANLVFEPGEDVHASRGRDAVRLEDLPLDPDRALRLGLRADVDDIRSRESDG
jgi:hypothetical protein